MAAKEQKKRTAWYSMTEELAAVEEVIQGAAVPGSTTLLLRLVPVRNAFHFRMTMAATGFPLMQGAAALAVAVVVVVPLPGKAAMAAST